MTHPPRMDAPGRWFHVMNRGIARRVVFRNRADIRYFLSLVARAVRRGEIEVHAFCVLATHFHLLVSSPTGRLSEALRRIQNEYVRYFNRVNRRDGPLFRGRFRSRPVVSLRYRRLLFGYIDYNPVQAGIVTDPSDYPYGSARHLASTSRPRWLSTWWSDEFVGGAQSIEPTATYATVLGRPPRPCERDLVRARIRSRPSLDDELDELVEAALARVREWIVRKADLADGSAPGVPLADAQRVIDVVARRSATTGPWIRTPPRGRPTEIRPIALCALLRDVAGLSHAAIAAHLEIAPRDASRLIARHRSLVRDPDYADRLAELARECLAPEGAPLRSTP